MRCGGNDSARICAKNGGSNNGELELATDDDAAEPIVARQYTSNGVATYNNVTREAYILDTNGDTRLPGILYVQGTDVMQELNNLKALL